VVNVAPIVQLDRRCDARACEHLVVARSGVPTHLGPLFDIFHLHAEDGALDTLKPHVEALEFVMIFLFGAPVAQHTDLAVEFRILGDHHAAFACSAKVLARIE